MISKQYIYISIPGLACGDCGPDPKVDSWGFGGSVSSLKSEGAPIFDCLGKLKIYGSIVPLRFQTSRSSHPSVKSLGVQWTPQLVIFQTRLGESEAKWKLLRNHPKLAGEDHFRSPEGSAAQQPSAAHREVKSNSKVMVNWSCSIFLGAKTCRRLGHLTLFFRSWRLLGVEKLP